MAKLVLFVDRDGTLIEEPPDNQVDRLDKIRLLPDVIPALLELRDAGYRFVMNPDSETQPSAKTGDPSPLTEPDHEPDHDHDAIPEADAEDAES